MNTKNFLMFSGLFVAAGISGLIAQDAGVAMAGVAGLCAGLIINHLSGKL